MKVILIIIINVGSITSTYTPATVNTSRYGNNSLRGLGGHIWNSLAKDVKFIDSVYLS